MKKLLSLTLALAIIICAVPLGTFTFTASAATEHTEGYYTYTVENGEATIIGTDYSICGNITIPSTLGGYPVAHINGGFDERPDITNVIIPTSVVSIENTFYRVGITTITIPHSVSKIYRCFSECYELNEINVDESNKYYCSIDGVLFSKDKTKLIAYPTNKNGALNISDSVTNIETSFYACAGITEFNVDKDNEFYCSVDGVLYDKAVTTLIKYPTSNKRRIYVIPDGVRTIKQLAIESLNLLRLLIPSSVDNIEYPAFNVPRTRVYGYEGSYAQQYFSGIYIIKEKAEIYYGTSKNIAVGETGIYNLSLTFNEQIDSDESLEFNALELPNILLYDKNNKQVKYNADKKGYPLIKGEKYNIKLRMDYKECSFNKKVDTIFPDTSANGWYNDAVTYAVGAGIMSGYSNGKFGTSDSIKRQDFLVMLARLDGVNLDNYKYKSSFPDVARNSYYEAAVNWGAQNGIVTGYQNGKFGVGDKVTREQLVTFLHRYAKYKGYDTSYSNNRENVVASQYKDYSRVSSFAKEPILWAIEKGVISGKTSSTIAPQGNAQRCEVAKIMYNIYLNDIFK